MKIILPVCKLVNKINSRACLKETLRGVKFILFASLQIKEDVLIPSPQRRYE